ncbi:transposase [Eubacterium sp. CAG:161]|uniref:transposase n=2 Tax=Eubacterium TaxID=1730 RepID=UPI00033D66EE|nr:transposase [Eubacterium sp. CAG:161]CCY69638.1 transposase IS4 family [Eubacterium sp. CAG:161]
MVIEKLIDISDPVYTFCDVMDRIDLTPYFVEGKGYKTGRPRCDAEKLLKVILFAFMENGYCSLREIEKLCNNDIRFMYLLDEMKAPTFATFGNFIRNELTTNIEDIFNDINSYIFDKEKVDLNHTYIDGTKIEANANKYTWVWKKSCTRNRLKVFGYDSELIDEIIKDSSEEA